MADREDQTALEQAIQQLREAADRGRQISSEDFRRWVEQIPHLVQQVRQNVDNGNVKMTEVLKSWDRLLDNFTRSGTSSETPDRALVEAAEALCELSRFARQGHGDQGPLWSVLQHAQSVQAKSNHTKTLRVLARAAKECVGQPNDADDLRLFLDELHQNMSHRAELGLEVKLDSAASAWAKWAKTVTPEELAAEDVRRLLEATRWMIGCERRLPLRVSLRVLMQARRANENLNDDDKRDIDDAVGREIPNVVKDLRYNFAELPGASERENVLLAAYAHVSKVQHLHLSEPLSTTVNKTLELICQKMMSHYSDFSRERAWQVWALTLLKDLSALLAEKNRDALRMFRIAGKLDALDANSTLSKRWRARVVWLASFVSKNSKAPSKWRETVDQAFLRVCGLMKERAIGDAPTKTLQTWRTWLNKVLQGNLDLRPALRRELEATQEILEMALIEGKLRKWLSRNKKRSETRQKLKLPHNKDDVLRLARFVSANNTVRWRETVTRSLRSICEAMQAYADHINEETRSERISWLNDVLQQQRNLGFGDELVLPLTGTIALLVAKKKGLSRAAAVGIAVAAVLAVGGLTYAVMNTGNSQDEEDAPRAAD